MVIQRLTSRRAKRGQAAVIVAMTFLVLLGFAGLAIDGGHVYLVRRVSQNATDAAALAAGKLLAAAGTRSGPLSPGDPALQAAHDVAYANGFRTNFGSPCQNTSTVFIGGQSYTQYSISWYDTATPCGASAGFHTQVAINSPPSGSTSNACTQNPNYCVQVMITQRIDNYLMGILGVPVTTSVTSATAFAQPAGNTFRVPPPIALYLYESRDCNPSTNQCYSTTTPPQRQLLKCTGATCPTFWVNPGAGPVIAGLNGAFIGAADQTAMESNGHMVIQDSTTICDPFGGAACTAGVARGARGFAIAPGSTLFCAGFGGGGSPGTLTNCTPTGPAVPLGTLYANETGFATLTWSPIQPGAQRNCGALVLNGSPVAQSGAAAGCVNSSEPYTVQPGGYQYIVVNHGTYDFEAGYYDITGTAPPGVIDHSRETSADFDLCAGQPGCNLTAGIWIGHGSGAFGPFQPPITGSCTGLNQSLGGGGDQTVISGSGVTFRLRTGGFVSTNEVASIALSAPGLGASLNFTGGVPLLIDLENSGFIHLDSGPGGGFDEDVSIPPSKFGGLIYQTRTATAGGVEMNPGLSGGPTTAGINGQVLAYSFTTFGGRGRAIDFSQGFGTASAPLIVPNGNNEQQILSRWSYGPAGPGKVFLEIVYNDEWALDAYNAFVKINNGAPRFFSQGVWNTTPGPTDPLPPINNNPGDSPPSNAAYPGPGNFGYNNYTHLTTATGLPDWTYTFPDDGSTFHGVSNWTWGHEQDIPGANSGTNHATLTYTFPTPPGSTVSATIYMSDGDSCGDFATVTVSFGNPGTPAAGQQTAASVRLEQ